MRGGSWPSSGSSLAMFTHWSPMRSTCRITCSSAATDAQVARDGRLQREQRQDPLVDLEVAAVDAVVVGDDERRQLDVLVLDGLERAVERVDDELERRRAPAPRVDASSSWKLRALGHVVSRRIAVG